MPPSRRENLVGISLPENSDCHAGLWLSKYRTAIASREEEKQAGPGAPRQARTGALRQARMGDALQAGPGAALQTAEAHIASAAGIQVPQVYRYFVRRWVDQLCAAGVNLQVGRVEGRMIVGLGGASVQETDIRLHPTFGVPIIPGSAIKGLLASYVRQALDPAQWGPETDAWRTLFGTGGDDGQAGHIIYYDALPEAAAGDKLVHADVLTVHHPDYYNQADPTVPADWDSPTPIAFASSTGSYYFALDGSAEWVTRAYELLAEALSELGIGAKTSSGYGRLKLRPYPFQVGRRVRGTVRQINGRQLTLQFDNHLLEEVAGYHQAPPGPLPAVDTSIQNLLITSRKRKLNHPGTLELTLVR